MPRKATSSKTSMQVVEAFSLDKPRKDNEGRISLNDLHRMSGSPANQDPRRWTELDSTKALVQVLNYQHVKTDGKSGSLEVLKTKEGRNGGTWAIRGLALAYANYLSPDVYSRCLKIFEERIEEEANPELALKRGMERAERRYKAMGRDDKWIAKRIKSVLTRNTWTEFAGKRGCITPDHFRGITNALYIGVEGVTAKEWRARKGLPEKENLRDHMSLRELASIELAEALAMEVAERDRIYGADTLAQAANRAGFHVQKCVRGALGASL